MSVSGADLLGWYDRHRRDLPWRARPGEASDPYRVWISEIMLQQTTVAAVIPYFQRFVTRFPDARALAAAPLEDVLVAWSGLGYYARARNLHRGAATIAAHGFPADLDALRRVAGIGEYTAAAVAAIAFGIPVVPVDGNVLRVAARVFGIDDPLPGGKARVARAAAALLDEAARARPSDFCQALFDLGATVCVPRNPACGVCPWQAGCAAHRTGMAGALPRRSPKAARPVRHGIHFWLEDRAGRVLLRRRPERGLLGGMTELPGTAWRAEPWTLAEAAPPMALDWSPAGGVRHVFTHFELNIALYAARTERIEAAGFLHPAADLAACALPSVMRKCAAAIARADRAWSA